MATRDDVIEIAARRATLKLLRELRDV